MAKSFLLVDQLVHPHVTAMTSYAHLAVFQAAFVLLGWLNTMEHV